MPGIASWGRPFAASVKTAYAETCAFTGLRIINGGGRAEVQAAHIRPVASGGSDSVRNGLALSGTLHWMFDRGLISVDEDYSILFAEGHLPAAIKRLFREDGKVAVPLRPEARPHPIYLRFHRMLSRGLGILTIAVRLPAAQTDSSAARFRLGCSAAPAAIDLCPACRRVTQAPAGSCRSTMATAFSKVASVTL